MTLQADEFVRRFLLHVPPGRFHRARHYGLLANSSRRENLARIRELLDVVPASIGLSANEVATVVVPPIFVCRLCGSPMVIIDILQRSRPIGHHRLSQPTHERHRVRMHTSTVGSSAK